MAKKDDARVPTPAASMFPTLNMGTYSPNDDTIRHALGIPDPHHEANYADKLRSRMGRAGLKPK